MLLLLPLAKYSLTRESSLRFNEVAWLNDLDPIKLSNDRMALDGNSWWSKVIHNRRVVYTQEFLQHYFDNFKPDFLFYSGDFNNRLSIQSVGEMYWIDLPLLLVGLFYLLKTWRQKSSQLIFAWLLLAPIPAAFARETPHALRILNILPVPQLIVALGLSRLTKFRIAPAILYLLVFVFYLYNYYFIYPVQSASGWQSGYKEMVQHVAAVQGKYSCISVTEALGRPYIYFLLYTKYPPEKYWATRSVTRDWFGFWYVRGFDKYRFGDINYPRENCLYVRTDKDGHFIYYEKT